MTLRPILLIMSAVAVVPLGAGCQDQVVRCDPLASSEAAVELGDVVAIGRSGDGRVFVVDDPGGNASFRLFVSEGESLVRREVAGGGTSNEDGFERIGLFVMDADPPFRVIVESKGDQTRMMVVEGEMASERNLNISQLQGTELEVVGESAIEELRLRDLPGDVHLEYSARIEDGQRLVVVRPEHDWTYEDFRVFFGPEQQLEEREVLDVSRQRDGGSTHISFRVGAKDARVFFPNRLTGDGMTVTEPVTLTIGSKEFGVERLSLEAPDVDDLAFWCLR